MTRPTKKDIKEAVEKLKDKPVEGASTSEPNVGKLTFKKNNQRIRKQGV